MELVKLESGKAVVSSKDIADKFNKQHRDVLKAIKALDCSPDFRQRNFTPSSYVSPQNKKLPCFDMTRDGFSFLCMGFTGREAASWKEKYINAFNLMEAVRLGMPATMKAMNEIVRLIEQDKELASLHGSELAKYRKVKRQNAVAYDKAEKEIQLVLGLK